MPTYAYECAACGHGLEEFQTMTAKPLRKCPACKALKLKRLIGPGAGFIFKGTGFYITDYKNKKSGSDGGSDAPPKTGDAPAKPADPAKTDAGKTQSPKDQSSPDRSAKDGGAEGGGAKSKDSGSGSGKGRVA